MESENQHVKIEENIEFGNRNFNYIKDQLMGGKVYANDDKSLYARTGTQEQNIDPSAAGRYT